MLSATSRSWPRRQPRPGLLKGGSGPSMAASDRRIRLGSAYYPEQSPRERWALDPRLMADVGLSLVRLGEFAWAELEPEARRFELAGLDQAIDVFPRQGLDIVLGA